MAGEPIGIGVILGAVAGAVGCLIIAGVVIFLARDSRTKDHSTIDSTSSTNDVPMASSQYGSLPRARNDSAATSQYGRGPVLTAATTNEYEATDSVLVQ